MSKIITLSGKGGVGKTTTTALLLDEMARFGYNGRLLVVDGDPAMTLYMALGLLTPAATLGNVRDQTRLDAQRLRRLPAGVTPMEYVRRQLHDMQVLEQHELRLMPFDMLAMGWGQGAGCYCAINNMLSLVLRQLLAAYDLIIVDNEAGLEHLARHRLSHVDLFVTVVSANRASQIVADRVTQAARDSGMTLAAAAAVCIDGPGPHPAGVIAVPYDPDVSRLMADSGAVTGLVDRSRVRYALRPLVLQALALGGYPRELLLEIWPAWLQALGVA